MKQITNNYLMDCRYLVNNVGFSGLRFDFSKGYAAKYAGLYSRDTVGLDRFVVGEFWKPLSYDSAGKQLYEQDKCRNELLEWLDEAGEGVTAFDFATKGILQVGNFQPPQEYVVCDIERTCIWHVYSYHLKSIPFARRVYFFHFENVSDVLRCIIGRGSVKHVNCHLYCSIRLSCAGMTTRSSFLVWQIAAG